MVCFERAKALRVYNYVGFRCHGGFEACIRRDKISKITIQTKPFERWLA